MRLFRAGLLAAALSAAFSFGARAQSTNATTTNGSVTITTGSTFQQVLAAVGTPPAIRRSLTIENNNATDSCWIFLGPTANATKGTSILLLAGGAYARYFPYVPSDAVQATCATSADTLYVDTQ